MIPTVCHWQVKLGCEDRIAMNMSPQGGSNKRGHRGELWRQKRHKLGRINAKGENQLNFKGEAGSRVHCPATFRHLDQLLHTGPGTKRQRKSPQTTAQKPQSTRGEEQDLGPAVTANLRRNANIDYSPWLLPETKGMLPD